MIEHLVDLLVPTTTGKLAALASSLLVMYLLSFVLRRRHQHKTFERMQVAGPKPHPIHGHLYDTRREAYVTFAARMHAKYGKTCGIYLGGDPFMLTTDLDLIQQVFVAKSRLFYDRMPFYLNVDPVPDNLICQRGERWRYMRRLLTPAFANAKIRSNVQFYRDTRATLNKFMRQLDSFKTRGGPGTGSEQVTLVEDTYDRMAAVALDVIVKTAFHMDNMIKFSAKLAPNADCDYARGKRLDSRPSDATQVDTFLETVKRACRLGFNPLVELIFCFPFLDKPLTFLCNHLYFNSIMSLLLNRLDHLVRKSNSSTEPEPEVDDSESRKLELPAPDCSKRQAKQAKRKRIIDSLIEVLRNKQITRTEFTGNAFVIVFAGFETTANALTFTLWLLARHPQVQRKLRHELAKALATATSTSGSYKSSSRAGSDVSVEEPESAHDAILIELATGCEYLEFAINESLRLYPPVPGLSCRQASQDCQLANGLRIEKGVNVIPSVFSIHRDASIWGADAHLFRPERFEMLDVTQLNSAMFMPFGLGPRNCIGKPVAMHEMKIALGLLLLQYEIQEWTGRTPQKLKLCSPINITITNSEKIGLKFVKINEAPQL